MAEGVERGHGQLGSIPEVSFPVCGLNHPHCPHCLQCSVRVPGSVCGLSVSNNIYTYTVGYGTRIAATPYLSWIRDSYVIGDP